MNLVELSEQCRAEMRLRIRSSSTVARLPFRDEGFGVFKCALKVHPVPQRVVEQRIAEISPISLVRTAERRPVGVGSGQNNGVVVDQRWDENAGKTGGHDDHAVLNAFAVKSSGYIPG